MVWRKRAWWEGECAHFLTHEVDTEQAWFQSSTTYCWCPAGERPEHRARSQVWDSNPESATSSHGSLSNSSSVSWLHLPKPLDGIDCWFLNSLLIHNAYIPCIRLLLNTLQNLRQKPVSVPYFECWLEAMWYPKFLCNSISRNKENYVIRINWKQPQVMDKM